MPEETPYSGRARALARVNVRAAASRTSAGIGKIEAGTSFLVTGLVTGEEISGNDRWFVTPGQTYVWSGACVSEAASAPMAATAPLPHAIVNATRRRPDGTIRPLPTAQIAQIFGSFPYSEGRKGAIIIARDWIQQNLVHLDTPFLAEEGYPSILVHRKAKDSFEAAFEDITRAGLEGHILSCAGTFSPRHMGWDPSRNLSSHSWGIAIDLNVAWNGYGSRPAPSGSRGSVRALVPIFAQHGFAWGGDFGAPLTDGMHFELARTDL